MATVSSLDRMLDPVTACFTPQVARKIVELQLEPELIARIQLLAEKANDGSLSADEEDEYQDYVEGGDLIALLQLKARRFLQQNGG